MSLCTTRGVGAYVASEAHTAAYGRFYVRQATRPVIFFTGGASGDRDFLDNGASANQLTPRLVEMGVPIISADFGGPNLYGNDTTQTRIGQIWTYVKTLMDTKTDKFIGIGVSKGFTALANYTRNNPNNVAALVGIVPGVSLTNVYADNASLQAGIDAAYTDHATFLTALPTHDPLLNTATHASQGTPMKLIWGDSDTTVRPADIATFASAVGASTKILAGATHLTTPPQVDPWLDIQPFIAPYV